ncbi:type II toxin-antitoxin system death-on-curing family toxin [Kitasatospora sp. NPDC001159]
MSSEKSERDAIARPQASLFGGDAHPDLWTRGAALGQSLSRNHPLVDRNKCTAFEAMLLFLDCNAEPYTDPPAACPPRP